MKNEYCKIFNKCFPQFSMDSKRFEKLICNPGCTYYDYTENGQIIGFAVAENYAVRLICVTPEKQHCGIGKKLIENVEKDLSAKGYDKIITGGVSSRLFIGAVSESWGFFEKMGYKSVGGCDEMMVDLKKFSIGDYKLHGHETAEYGWYDGDMEEIHKAVSAVDKEWVQYYTMPDNIYVARVNNEIASFCLVGKDCVNYLTDSYGRIGMPGCVGTVPKFRNKGIAIEMIANVTEYLKNEGMDISFIFFTGVSEWYEKIGYRTFLSEVFGEKRLV